MISTLLSFRLSGMSFATERIQHPLGPVAFLEMANRFDKSVGHWERQTEAITARRGANLPEGRLGHGRARLAKASPGKSRRTACIQCSA